MSNDKFILSGYPVSGFDKATKQAWDEMAKKFNRANRNDIGTHGVTNIWIEVFAFDQVDFLDPKSPEPVKVATLEEFRSFFKSLPPQSQYVRLQMGTDGKLTYGHMCDLGTEFACNKAAEDVFNTIEDGLEPGQSETIHLLSGDTKIVTGKAKKAKR